MSPGARVPRVSIAVPVYNGERYLRESLDGLLAQTFTDFELVIADNASTDGTETICREYAARDPRVREQLRHHPHHLGLSRWRGVELIDQGLRDGPVEKTVVPHLD